MDFEHSERAKKYIERVSAFIDERIVPNHATYQAQLAHEADFASGESPRSWRS